MINTLFPCSLKRLGAFAMAISLLCGCALMTPANTAPPNLYSFDNASVTVKTDSAAMIKIRAPTIIVSIPHASAGFASHQIIYMRQPHKLEHFRQSEWIATPAAMLAPLITSALERSGQFSAVVQSPTSALSQLRLDVEIVRLQQEFFNVPSRVHFTLRAHILDTATRQVIAWREFDTVAPSNSEDPYGGVLAANSAVRAVVEELATFCVQVSGNTQKNQGDSIDMTPMTK